jgi:hypothetical protein
MRGEGLMRARAEEGAAAVRDLPISIRVGAHDVAVVAWAAVSAAAAQRWGEWSAMEQCIRVQENPPTPQRAVEIVLHEVLHAVWWAYDVPVSGVQEEQAVAILGGAMTALWRDNPALLSWVARWSNGLGADF